MEKELKFGIGVGVILLNEKREVLLGLRNDDKDIADSDLRLEGTFTLPSGKVKYGETFEEAGIRKVKDETNLDVNKIKVISLQNDINEYAHYATIGLLGEEYSGDIKIKSTNEIVKWEWFSLNNLPSNLCFPSKKIIDCYINNKFYNDKKD